MSRILLFLILMPIGLVAQETVPASAPDKWNYSFDAQYFYGTILRHNKNIGHLIKQHPKGVILSFNKKTEGSKYWQKAYNFPDWGISFLYQNFKTQELGRNFGLYGHYNFYFLRRRLQLRIAEGIAYNTNPFNIDTNFKNNAYGSKMLASTYLLLNYHQPRVINGLGLQFGFSFIHHSNGSFKAPNSGTNVIAFNAGLNYDVQYKNVVKHVLESTSIDWREKMSFNFIVRAGLNEGDFYNLGQHPFVVLGAFADKRLGYKSTLQLGTEVFFSTFLKKEIEYRSVAFPSSGLKGDEDYKRVSVFVGHEFRIGDFAIPTQLGYYLYWPYAYENRTYFRAGVKYYFTNHVFGVGTVKTHAANAEALEFGIGIRL